MNRLVDHHLSLNASTRDRWQAFSRHRDRQMQLLMAGSRSGGRLCVLGAGNCNDLDLRQLVDRFDETVLVDLDAESLMAGVDRQGLAGDSRLKVLGAVDVTGCLELISSWTPQSMLSADDLEALDAASPTAMARTAGGRFDMVASTCLLSQLIAGLAETISDRHPSFIGAMQVLRGAHLGLISELLHPGGRMVLVCDLVSSVTAPGLGSFEEAALGPVVLDLLRSKNFFTGMNPVVVLELVRTFERSGRRFTQVNQEPPWIWDVGTRQYLAYAVTAHLGDAPSQH